MHAMLSWPPLLTFLGYLEPNGIVSANRVFLDYYYYFLLSGSIFALHNFLYTKDLFRFIFQNVRFVNGFETLGK
jgi:hypothetical protein